ncbi:MAG: hypothetical protein V1738_02120 [Patescibacteria group bacterium]
MQGETVTAHNDWRIIDFKSADMFAHAHLPNNLNIPYEVINLQ